jgi:lanthanide-dependent methanol dehydrogenase
MHIPVFVFLTLSILLGTANAQKAEVPSSASPAEDGEWRVPTKDYANTRFSGLDQITPQNIKNLRVEFAFSTGTRTGNESATIVVGNTLYFVTPYPNVLYAIDLTKPGGTTKWKFEPNPSSSALGAACCEAVNRGPTYSNGTIFFNTIDNNTIALDATTGKLKWRVVLGDFTKGETMTMAPFVVKDKVLVGNSGAEFGARGWVTALNTKDGSIAWRAYATGPDRDVLIDTETFKPFYPQYKGKDLGVSQWPVDAWKTGGGTMWGWISYDPEQNLVFHGTSNPSPWNHEVRPGDNHWTNGIFARDADTGEARWFYQFSPHDMFDHSAINENIVLDLDWEERRRKVVVRPERNGYVYVIDRTTGEVLAADPFIQVNASHGIDLKTGRLRYAEEKRPTTGKVTRNVCPNAPGAKDWSPSSFSKITGLIYMPFNNLCMDWQPTEVNYIAGTPYIGVDTTYHLGPGGHGGGLIAWDPIQRKKIWEIKENWPVWSGTAVTAAGVVFYGTLEGWFKAVSADTGELLWQFQTGSGIVGQPATWRGPDGRQYVSILSGIGGWIGGIVNQETDPRDRTAHKGFGNFTADLKAITRRGGMLYVFSLPK